MPDKDKGEEKGTAKFVRDKTLVIENEINIESKPRIKHLLKLWKYVFTSIPVMCSIYLGLYIILSIMRPLLAFIWGKYIDNVSNFISGESVIPAILLVTAFWFINFLVGLINRYVVPMDDIERLSIVQSNRMQEILISKLYKKIAALSPEYFEVSKINDNINRIFAFFENQWDGLSTQVMMQSYIIIAKLVSLVSIAMTLYLFNPWLCLIVLIAPLPTLYMQLIGQKLRFKFTKDNSELMRKANYFENVLLNTGAKEMKVFGLYRFFFDKWKMHINEFTKKETRLYRNQTIINIVSNTIFSICSIAANILAIVFFTMRMISLGSLGAVMSLISTLLEDTKQLIVGFAVFFSKKNEGALFSDFNSLNEQVDEGELVSSMTEIKAENLRYRYPLVENYSLDGITIEIKKGEKVALVGENGAGKSTFVKILTGLISPSEGYLYINGIEADEIAPSSRYNSMSVVMQEPAKYTTFNVSDNVFLGDTRLTRNEERIGDALKFSGFNIAQKDDLLGKDIGGTELSGGEWQKLAIARAQYRSRNFIVLDEPTSNIDPVAESEIFQKYMKMAENRTVIIVTHRISIASLANRIIVFEKGRVVEDGSHDDLMAQNGKYAQLYREQAKWYDR